jgi:hypothetical protein
MYYSVTISSIKSLVEVMWRFARCTRTTTFLIRWWSLFHNQSMRRTWGPWVLDTYMSDLDVSGRLVSWLCTVWITIIYTDNQVCDLFIKLFVVYEVILNDPYSILLCETQTSTCINWWSRFIDHGYGDIKLIMWTHVRNMVLDRPTRDTVGIDIFVCAIS